MRRAVLVLLWGAMLLPLKAWCDAPSALGTTSTVVSEISAQGDLPVICYHRFGPEDEKDTLKISEERLADQLRWLKKEGYRSITTEQAVDFMDGKTNGLPAKPILLTVDDGYRSGWSVGGPIFKRFGFKAVYFIITDQVGDSKNFLGWDDLKEIMAEGFEVQCHTKDHSNLGKPLKFRPKRAGRIYPADFSEKHLTKYETASEYHGRLLAELVTSKKVLEKNLGITMTALAYPFGAYNPTVESYAVAAGYHLILTVSGGVNLPGDNPHRARRIILMGHPTLESFQKKVLERRLLAKVNGIREGDGFFPSELPHRITIQMPDDWNPKEGIRAEIQSHWVALEQEQGKSVWDATLGKDMKPGFYFFRVETGDGETFARDSYLFQIYPPGTRAYMTELSPTAKL